MDGAGHRTAMVPADVAKRINKVKRRMHTLDMEHAIYMAFCDMVIIILIALTALMACRWFVYGRSTSHTPVKVSDITAERGEALSGQYPLSVNQAYIKNGTTYYNVTIGDYTVVEKESAVSGILDNGDTEIDSTVYTITFTNTGENSFLPFLYTTEFTAARFSALGEEDFTDEEIESYKEQAAEYFTYKKYSLFRFSDAENYNITVKDISMKGGLDAKIRALLGELGR